MVATRHVSPKEGDVLLLVGETPAMQKFVTEMGG